MTNALSYYIAIAGMMRLEIAINAVSLIQHDNLERL